MASLKEVKGRISSVRSIWKITSAMRMIASAKLHRAQTAVINMIPYERKLHGILASLLQDEIVSPYAAVPKEIKTVAIVVFSSNSSLCGAFNINALKKLEATIAEKYPRLKKSNLLIFPVGRKIHDMAAKAGYNLQGDDAELQKMIEDPDYQSAAGFARKLMEAFRKHEVDQVELVYNHFKSMAVQVPTNDVFLPIPKEEPVENSDKSNLTNDFILEPSRDELVDTLVPKSLELKIFTTLLDSVAAEHAARTVAMQLATDNANEMLDELTLLYNKSRQQAITNELLDIISGTAAQ